VKRLHVTKRDREDGWQKEEKEKIPREKNVLHWGVAECVPLQQAENQERAAKSSQKKKSEQKKKKKMGDGIAMARIKYGLYSGSVIRRRRMKTVDIFKKIQGRGEWQKPRAATKGRRSK